MVGVLQ